MVITIEMLSKMIEDITAQKHEMVAQLNSMEGTIRGYQHLIQELEKDAIEVVEDKGDKK
jgi:hypothetical protein